MSTWRMYIACWMSKATNTHSEYLILIVFRLQQRLEERTSVLRYTHIARLVNFISTQFHISLYKLIGICHTHVCFQIHVKFRNALCGQNVNVLCIGPKVPHEVVRG
jgi:hypothetical protein